MGRVRESGLYVGQEVVYRNSTKNVRGTVERIDDTCTPALVTVRWSDGCKGCRTTNAENLFEPAPRIERPLRMVPPRSGITRLAR